jgi:hypothetical protein
MTQTRTQTQKDQAELREGSGADSQEDLQPGGGLEGIPQAAGSSDSPAPPTGANPARADSKNARPEAVRSNPPPGTPTGPQPASALASPPSPTKGLSTQPP